MKFTPEQTFIVGETLNIQWKAETEFLTGRVEDWRAGLGRCSCSLLSRPFVCECHSISTMPRFQLSVKALSRLATTRFTTGKCVPSQTCPHSLLKIAPPSVVVTAADAHSPCGG
jgi:hypothetical protein